MVFKNILRFMRLFAVLGTLASLIPLIHPIVQAQTTARTVEPQRTVLETSVIAKSMKLIGSGVVQEIVFSPKGSEIAVSTTLGIEILDSSNLSPVAFYPVKAGPSRTSSYRADGQQIAVVAGSDAFIIDRQTGEVVQIQKAKQVTGIAFSPDGRLFTLLTNGVVQVWDSQQDLNKFAVAEPKKWHQHLYRPRAIAFSTNGTYVATGAADRVISVRRLSDSKWIGNLTGAGLINGLSFSMDESQLVAGSLEGVRVWSTRTMQRTKKLHSKRTGYDYHLATDQMHSQFATISHSSGKAVIWDLMLERKEFEFQADIGTITVAFHPNGEQLVTATPYSIKIWNPSNGKVITRRDIYYRVNNFGFSADSTKVILSTVREADGLVFGDLMLWDIPTNQMINHWPAHQSEISTVRFSPDGNRILSRSITEPNPEDPKRPNQVLRMWDANTFEQIGTDLIANRDQIETRKFEDPDIIAPFDFNVEVEAFADAFDVTKDQTYIVITDEQKMVLWKAPKQFHFRERSYWPVIYRQQTSRAASNNAKHVVVAKDKYIEIDLGPGTPRPVLAEHRGLVKQMQFSFDSRYLASLSWNTGVCVLWQFEGNPSN